MGVVSLSQPVEDIGHQLEVGLFEVLDGDKPGIPQRPQHFDEVPALPVGHLPAI